MLTSDLIIENSLKNLTNFVKISSCRGYDPYDGLNSQYTTFFFDRSKWLRILIIQLNKKSPLNFRTILGVNKGIDVKGSGLFATAFLKLYALTGETHFLENARFCLDFLKQKSLKENYSNHCWSGHYYKYQSINTTITPEMPDIISTVTCASAFLEDYKTTGAEESLEIAKNSADFIVNNLFVNNNEKPFFKYTLFTGPNEIVYNASTHAVMFLSNLNRYSEENKNSEIMKNVMDFIISKQKPNGVWYYSENDNNERRQVDFHQGFIIESFNDFIKNTNSTEYLNALTNGIEFYRNEQFFDDGRCKYRWPKVFPLDIHNQAQGIITFSKLSRINPEYLEFAKTIALWTIENMQDPSGYYYYRKHRFFINKIPYMRWGQSWMMLALSTLLEAMQNGE